MIKRITDLQGFFIRDDFTYDEETEIALNVIPAQGLYKPKWNGEQWIEGMSVEEIQAIPQTPTELSIEDRLNTVETDVVEVKDILGVLYG